MDSVVHSVYLIMASTIDYKCKGNLKMDFSVDLKFHSYVISLPLILEMSTTLVTMYKTIHRFYS